MASLKIYCIQCGKNIDSRYTIYMYIVVQDSGIYYIDIFYSVRTHTHTHVGAPIIMRTFQGFYTVQTVYYFP